MKRWLLGLFLSALLPCCRGPESAPDSSAVAPDDDASTPAAGDESPLVNPPPDEDAEAGAVDAEVDFWSAGPVEASVDGGDDDSTATLPPPPSPPFDAGEGGICPQPLAPGALVIDELMIESVAGTGDHGEWLEIQSTLDCAADLRGLHGDAPSGSTVRSFVVGTDLWVPAFGTLVVADSTNAAVNHALPGPLVAWSGQPGDVLRNKGDTINLRMNGLLLDTVTYPAVPLVVGTSLAFPSDCAPDLRSDWSAWQPSASSWFPGFSGTPNAPNSDVHCL